PAQCRSARYECADGSSKLGLKEESIRMVRCNTWKPAALVLLALLILGAPLQAQTVTITHLQYLPHGDGWKAYVEEMAEEFMRLHPDVKIDFIAAGSADYRDKM